MVAVAHGYGPVEEGLLMTELLTKGWRMRVGRTPNDILRANRRQPRRRDAGGARGAQRLVPSALHRRASATGW